jgi:hypothetical protein
MRFVRRLLGRPEPPAPAEPRWVERERQDRAEAHEVADDARELAARIRQLDLQVEVHQRRGQRH